MYTGGVPYEEADLHPADADLRYACPGRRSLLHGGSGLSDDDFRNTIRDGIAKMNIFTDLCLAGNRAMEDGLAAKEAYLDIRNRKVAYIKEVVKNKIRLFGSENKA